VEKERAKLEREQEMPRGLFKNIEDTATRLASLQKENDELKQKLSQMVSQQTESNNFLCSMVIHHQNARSPNSTPKIVVGSMGTVGRKESSSGIGRSPRGKPHLFGVKGRSCRKSTQIPHTALQQEVDDL